MPKTPPEFVIDFAPEYMAELRALVERIGVGVVAEAAGVTRMTLWRQLSPNTDRAPNFDGIQRIRRALATIAPADAMPPPVVAVRGRAHHAWIQIAETLSAAELEAIADDPAAIKALVKKQARKK